MINKYVIGTLLDIRLNFWKKGNTGGSAKVVDVPCDISGYRRSVFYKTSKGVVNVEDSFCSGSTLTWQYKGTDQRITGIYTIVVILYNSDGSELIHQEFEGFGLIMPKYCNEPQPDRHIVRDAWVELYEFHPVIPEVSAITENWIVDGVDTGKVSRGNGWFAGTELTESNLSIQGTFSEIISRYGNILKKGDIYYNVNTSDVYRCESVTVSAIIQTSLWRKIANIKGKDFKYSDFTPEQIDGFMKPANDAAAIAREAAEKAKSAAQQAKDEADKLPGIAADLQNAIDTAAATNSEIKSNESDRLKSEQKRENSESIRVAAEQARASAEEARKTAEDSRINKENLRINAESQRESNESEREARENQRVAEFSNMQSTISGQLSLVDQSLDDIKQSENNRVTNEAERIAAEEQRILNEEERQSAEAIRLSSETERQENEEQRISTFNTFQGKLTELEGIVKEINIPFFNRKAYIDLSSAVLGEIYTDKLGLGLYNYAKIECHEGEIFVINTIKNTISAKAYAILDSDNRVLAVEQTAVDKEIVIPAGGIILYVNSNIDASAYIKRKDNAIQDNKEGISELRTDVGISIGCEYGAINYLTGQLINDTNFCRTNQRISINANSIIKMQFPISVKNAYLIKYKDGVYAGYAEIGKIDATEYNYRITYDGSYDSFELRFEVKLTAEQLSSVNIIFSQGAFINELGKATEDITTIKTDIEDLKEKQSYLYDKEYFVDRVNQYVDLNYNVGDYADLTMHEKFSGYGYVIVELYQGESVTANVSGGTVRAKSITVIGRSGIILFNKTYTYNDTYTAIEDCIVIFNMRIADGYSIVAHKDKSKMYNQDIYTDVVFNTMLVKRLNLSGYRNIGEFGKIIIDELYSHYLALVPNHNLPHTKDYGFITTDADFVQEFEDSNDEVRMMRAKSPCFYYDGKRKGCFVLFDEAGEAYIIDNTGNKKYLSFK